MRATKMMMAFSSLALLVKHEFLFLAIAGLSKTLAPFASVAKNSNDLF